jgi:hypothetical protein
MTTLTKPVRRECARTSDRGRNLILELSPGDVIRLRRKGTRTVYVVSIGAVWSLAAKLYARDVAMEKKAKRHARSRP